jgi:hypothetical protein
VVAGVHGGQAGDVVVGERERGRFVAAAQDEGEPGDLRVAAVVAGQVCGLPGQQQGVEGGGDVVRNEVGGGLQEGVAGRAARPDVHLAGEQPRPGLDDRGPAGAAQELGGPLPLSRQPGLPGRVDQGGGGCLGAGRQLRRVPESG